MGIFGAFIGGEFVAAMFQTPPPVVAGVVKGVAPVVAAVPLSVLAIALSVLGACLMLGLLGLMRRVVGPMGPHKTKNRR